MKRISFLILLLLIADGIIAFSQYRGVVVDENRNSLPFATVSVYRRGLGLLSDSTGHFSFPLDRVMDRDTIRISYLGYLPQHIPVNAIKDAQTDTIVLYEDVIELDELKVTKKNKTKRVRKGKKHNRGIVLGFYDGKTAGDSFGYEFHSPKNKRYILDNVGFFYSNLDKTMQKMKFRINVYDMKNVKTSLSSDFMAAIPQPIYFDYVKGSDDNGRFVFTLEEPIMLPRDAMVEIEMLEDLGENKLWYRCNMFGARVWGKHVRENYWIKDPFASPFFVECIEVPE